MGVEAEVSEVDLDSSWSLRGPSDVVRVENGRDKVTNLSAVSARNLSASAEEIEVQTAPAPAQSSTLSQTPRRDWAAALTLVQEAAEAIRLSEERNEELRREAEEQAQQHHSDLTALHGQLRAAQREIEAANQRARAAEQRASEANDWLTRLDDAITANLGAVGRSS